MSARAIALATIITLVATSTACSAGSDAGSRAGGAASSTGGDSMPSFGTPGASSAGQPAGARLASTESTAATPRRRAFDICALLPTDTVARVLRGSIGRSVSFSTTRPGGMCTYRDVASGEPRVRVLLDVGRDRSAAAAGVDYLTVRGQLGGQGIQTTDIPGVGDAAFGSSDSTGSYAVWLQQDALTARVNVRVKGAHAASLRPAAVELSRRLLTVVH